MQIPQEKLQRVVCQVGKAKRRANESSLARLVPLQTFKGCGNTSELRWYSDKQFALFGVDCIFLLCFCKTAIPWCKNCCDLCRSGAKVCPNFATVEQGLLQKLLFEYSCNNASFFEQFAKSPPRGAKTAVICAEVAQKFAQTLTCKFFAKRGARHCAKLP